jgi:WXG100 family type VII secretion target
MGLSVQLKYDELRTLVKHFKNEGEDLFALYIQTREKLNCLKSEWVGEGANKFFEEMEQEVLPALKRASEACFSSQNVLMRVITIISDADQETKKFFTGSFFDFKHIHLPNFNAVLGGLPNQPGVVEGLTGDSFGETSPPGQGLSGPGETGAQTQSSGSEQTSSTGTASGADSGVGSGGSTGTNQGGSGNTGSMGSGLGEQTPAGSSGAGGGASAGSGGMPDHIYPGTSSGEIGGSAGINLEGGTGGGSEESSGGAGAAAAAGAAVLGGAAAGGIGKAVRGNKGNGTTESQE